MCARSVRDVNLNFNNWHAAFVKQESGDPKAIDLRSGQLMRAIRCCMCKGAPLGGEGVYVAVVSCAHAAGTVGEMLPGNKNCVGAGWRKRWHLLLAWK